MVVLRVVLVYFYLLFEIEVASMMSVSCSYWIDQADVLDDVIDTEFLPPVLAREEHRLGFGYIELARAQEATIKRQYHAPKGADAENMAARRRINYMHFKHRRYC